ncbi:MAG TPA: hypothetical protein VGG64_19830 [Pirellulales bacterium]|jgi:hypothetical protein
MYKVMAISLACLGTAMLVELYLSSDEMPGQRVYVTELKSVVAAGYSQKPVAGAACQGGFVANSTCQFTAASPGPDGVMGTADDVPAACSGAGGAAAAQNIGCGGQAHTTCQGGLVRNNYQAKQFLCCQVNVGTCNPTTDANGKVTGCTVGAPMQQKWVGNLTQCQDQGGLVKEG